MAGGATAFKCFTYVNGMGSAAGCLQQVAATTESPRRP